MTELELALESNQPSRIKPSALHSVMIPSPDTFDRIKRGLVRESMVFVESNNVLPESLEKEFERLFQQE